MRTLPLNDPEWGHMERKQLGVEYELFVERYQERKRDGRALEALGRPARGELSRLDPLAALGPAPALPDGEAARTNEGTSGPARSRSEGRQRSLYPGAAQADGHGGDGGGSAVRGGAPTDPIPPGGEGRQT